MTPNDDQQAAIDELLDAIVAARPGSPAVWSFRGVEVTVYGQRRWDLDTPTPWATITIAGRIRPIHTWVQILDEIADLTRDGDAEATKRA